MKYILLLLLIMIPTALADTSTIDNSYFEYANIYIIHADTIQNFSQTNGSDVPANTLSLKINNSWINLSATEDVYISNISYNVTIDSWNWSANSSILSHLNVTAFMQNASTAHHLYVNNSIVSTNLSNSDAIVNVNYSLNDTGCNAQGCATQLWNWMVTSNMYPPGVPENLDSTQGNFWINHTWQSGIGNITESYNVSVNGSWTNGTTFNYSNNTVGLHGWSNISVWAWNGTGNGSLSLTAASANTQLITLYPHPPTGFNATTGNFWANITWQAVQP